jgi:MFS transporter, DHA2 family, glioxin efflux transporter
LTSEQEAGIDRLQTLAGLGCGFGTQELTIAGQALMKLEDIFSATAMILFAQTLVGTLAISEAPSAFLNSLTKSLVLHAPAVEAKMIVLAETTELRNVFNDEEMAGGLRSHDVEGLKNPFTIGVVTAGMTFFVAFSNRWHVLKEANAAKSAHEKGEIPEKDFSLGRRNTRLSIRREKFGFGLRPE